MKKFLMLICLSLALVFVPTIMNAQNPFALSVHGGYSWLNGVVGGELQIGHFGVSGGWMPTKMPLSKDKISSIGGAISAYTGNPDETTYYVSLGIASNGYRYQATSNYGYSDEFTSPMNIVMVGCKSGNNVANCRIGGGYGWCEYGNSWTFEITLGFVLFSNI
jgi:hypothetical protein